MTKQKNLSRMGLGRKPGATNRTTRVVREAMARFVEHNLADAQQLYARVAAKNPALALEILGRFAELVLPKNMSIDAEVRPAPPPPQLGISFEDGGPGRVRRTPYLVEVHPNDVDPARTDTAAVDASPRAATNAEKPKVVDLSLWEKLAGDQ